MRHSAFRNCWRGRTTTEQIHHDNGVLAAAIDIGSNAIRLRIGGLDAEGRLKLVDQHREAIRLGHEAFTSGSFSEQTLTRVVTAFSSFKKVIDRYPVQSVRATGTSALRDADNGSQLVALVRKETGISVEVISGEEEARLIHMSIRHQLPDLDEQIALLIDIGGGSVEVTLCEYGDIVAVESFRMGTVRMLEWFGGGAVDALDLNLMNEYLAAMLRKVGAATRDKDIDVCVGTGGNIEALGTLSVDLLGNTRSDCLSARDIRRLCKRLKKMSCVERIEKLLLRPDRADVIIPATLILKAIVGMAEPADLRIAGAGLGDGVLIDLLAGHEPGGEAIGHQALAWARALAKKFHADLDHSDQVVGLAGTVFQAFSKLHKLEERDGLLLNIAAQLHEIGLAVRPSRHHRHAEYLVAASPMIGLTNDEKAMVSALLRYQRKRFPDEGHVPFDQFDKKGRGRLRKLSILLRLAIALDKERKSHVKGIHLTEGQEGQFTMEIQGTGDRLLEAWSVRKQLPYFQSVFDRGMDIVIADPVISAQ